MIELLSALISFVMALIPIVIAVIIAFFINPVLGVLLGLFFVFTIVGGSAFWIYLLIRHEKSKRGKF